MSRNIKIAMLGTGFIAEFRTQVYAQLKGADIVAVLGRNSERTQKFADTNAIGFAATSFEELLNGPQFEAVVCFSYRTVFALQEPLFLKGLRRVV